MKNVNSKPEEIPYLLEGLEEANEEIKKAKNENKNFQYIITLESDAYKIKNQYNQEVEVDTTDNPKLKELFEKISKHFKSNQKENSNKTINIYLNVNDKNVIISGEFQIGNDKKEKINLNDDIKGDLQTCLLCLKTKFSIEQNKKQSSCFHPKTINSEKQWPQENKLPQQLVVG